MQTAREGKARERALPAHSWPAMAVYLEVGARNPLDLTTCSDIDMMSSNADGRFVHKNGTPYSSS
jgi:uncharacterized cupin superfamily protein